MSPNTGVRKKPRIILAPEPTPNFFDISLLLSTLAIEIADVSYLAQERRTAECISTTSTLGGLQ
jgi:hypothetical protein